MYLLDLWRHCDSRAVAVTVALFALLSQDARVYSAPGEMLSWFPFFKLRGLLYYTNFSNIAAVVAASLYVLSMDATWLPYAHVNLCSMNLLYWLIDRTHLLPLSWPKTPYAAAQHATAVATLYLCHRADIRPSLSLSQSHKLALTVGLTNGAATVIFYTRYRDARYQLLAAFAPIPRFLFVVTASSVAIYATNAALHTLKGSSV